MEWAHYIKQMLLFTITIDIFFPAGISHSTEIYGLAYRPGVYILRCFVSPCNGTDRVIEGKDEVLSASIPFGGGVCPCPAFTFNVHNDGGQMKNWIQAFSVIDFISAGILVTAVSINTFKRIEPSVKAYTLNSWLLSALTAVAAFMTGEVHLYAASVVTFISKGVLIPMFLRRIVKRIKATHDVEPYISNALSLTISGILVVTVYASLKEGIVVTGLSKNVLQISIAVILIGLFIMITRRKAIIQVIGLLFMENGLFLAGFALTFGMPLIRNSEFCSICSWA